MTEFQHPSRLITPNVGSRRAINISANSSHGPKAPTVMLHKSPERTIREDRLEEGIRHTLLRARRATANDANEGEEAVDSHSGLIPSAFKLEHTLSGADQ